jgi:hypothetical protein
MRDALTGVYSRGRLRGQLSDRGDKRDSLGQDRKHEALGVGEYACRGGFDAQFGQCG